MPAIVRQGDVLLIPIPTDSALPKGTRRVARTKGRIILAEGEVTGHAHAIADHEAELLALDANRRFLRVLATSVLSHEEHAAITLDPGLYRVVIQREYDPSARSLNSWRQVLD